MSPKYTPRPMTSFVEDDFELSGFRKPARKPLPSKVALEKPISIKIPTVEKDIVEAVSIKSISLDDDFTEVVSPKAKSSETVDRRGNYANFATENTNRRFIVLTVRVIMLVLAFVIAFLLYSLIDSYISYQQQQRFHPVVGMARP